MTNVANVRRRRSSFGVVTALEIASGDGREITLEAGGAIVADGVVITGAGPAVTVPGQPRDSDPGEWPRLAEAHRREFLERTDRGVFRVTLPSGSRLKPGAVTSR
jgi:hypothetical protein